MNKLELVDVIMSSIIQNYMQARIMKSLVYADLFANMDI